MPLCPRCRASLREVDTKAGRIRRCGACDGVAVNLAVVRRATDAVTSRQVSEAVSGGIPGDWQCPICEGGMATALLSGSGFLTEIGACSCCELLWFDGGDYESLPEREQGVAADSELSLESRRALAEVEVARLSEVARETTPLPEEGWKWVLMMLGLPVELRGPGLSRPPWSTVALLFVILAISLVALGNLESAIVNFGLVPGMAWRLGGLTFLSSCFIHAGFIHLFGNLYFLFAAGSRAEDCLGTWRYLLLFSFSALCAGLTHVIMDPREMIPVIGASGGISGLIAFYALRFPRAKLGIRILVAWAPLPAWGLFVFWLALQGIGTWGQVRGFGSASALAHLGGAFGGFILWLVWKEFDRGREVP